MEIILSPGAKKDIQFWDKSGPKAIKKRIELLLLAIQESPFEGIGKPEPLKNHLSGCWSRRIDEEHHIVYSVEGEVYFLSLHPLSPFLNRLLAFLSLLIFFLGFGSTNL